MTREIPKAYEPQKIEARWANTWFEERLFRAAAHVGDKIFSIALPPPNVTGSIHIGHMLEHTQIDILARWHRMRGFATLWLPGMDHAGIGTQFVVERELAKQGLKREDLGREEFERRVWQWKAESGGTIKNQMIRLGASCDWTRERFTLEPALYRAVLEAFLRLYHEGLIYRGRYMVNWCPRCQTAISDLEVAHQERQGKLWYIRYPLVGANGHLVVATTRPETMLGDTALAVHPDDDRYRKFVGRKVLLPLMNREIPVIADSFVDREFGTGVVKVTPAHDPNDFEAGKRHKLPEIDIMTNDGHMSAAAGAYAGMDRFAARKKVVADLTALGRIEKIMDHTYSVGVCDRCKTEVEPRISIQWFCKMRPLADPALAVVREGVIPVVPDNQRAILIQWLENIRDWCISRQLWWGHRIPVWHCGECGGMTPALDSRIEVVNGRAQAASAPTKCAKCDGPKLTQDPDVLDTWFSSALWPFSTLGWPDETDDLRTYYPTSLLISGSDILFFWDARMIMMALHLTSGAAREARIPFKQLYLHAIVRDPRGMKMSKTRGNVVDPLEVVGEHGTDALRFALTVMAAPGRDIALSEDRILSYRAFANKIWNAARFLFVNLEKAERRGLKLEELAAPDVRAKAPYSTSGAGELAHRWIFSRLAFVIARMNDALENFRFHEAAHVIYHFFWGDFCDWYIEWVKPDLAATDTETARAAWRNIFAAFEIALRLLHPFMPFVSEELWQKLPQRSGARSIALEPFPELQRKWSSAGAEDEMASLQEIITKLREIRSELELDPKQKVTGYYSSDNPLRRELVKKNIELVMRLAGLSELQVSAGRLDPAKMVIRSAAEFDVGISHGDMMNKKAEAARLRKQIERLDKVIQSKKERYDDLDFRKRAPEAVVRNLATTLAERQLERKRLRDQLAQFEG